MQDVFLHGLRVRLRASCWEISRLLLKPLEFGIPAALRFERFFQILSDRHADALVKAVVFFLDP
eukprot:3541898-Pyramimonas_sp.AAC.1